jgi:hypothetical protein
MTRVGIKKESPRDKTGTEWPVTCIAESADGDWVMVWWGLRRSPSVMAVYSFDALKNRDDRSDT